MVPAGPDEVEAAVNQLLQQEPDLFRQLPAEEAARSGSRPGPPAAAAAAHQPGRSGSRPDSPAGRAEPTAIETAASSSPASQATSETVCSVFQYWYLRYLKFEIMSTEYDTVECYGLFGYIRGFSNLPKIHP
jgi:hypothetical protein